MKHLAKVEDLIVNGNWVIPDIIQEVIELAGFNVASLAEPDVTKDDHLVWTPDLGGEFKVKSAFEEIRVKREKNSWHSHIWNSHVPVKTASTAWKLITNAAAVDVNVQRKGVHLASRCYVCYTHEESLSHLLWHCEHAQTVWKWVASKFEFRLYCSSFTEVISASKSRSPMIKQLWDVVVTSTMVTLWHHRNLIYHEEKAVNFNLCTARIRRMVRASAMLITGHSFHRMADRRIMTSWNLLVLLLKAPRIRKCWWTSPTEHTVKINCDGSAIRNPVLRDWFYFPGCFGRFSARYVEKNRCQHELYG
ncbi:hypothetical protein IFM89_005806 [Coptis chinensis]|uniref:Reverse transcriptase zinc-binding domain-containing protein n=1 Tax=Coptis chinensis TaxID=261450 RepID=A0A835M7G9_9MAGN|nr:hypothetical protein IFM89_005806 [Coptis chinensis]